MRPMRSLTTTETARLVGVSADTVRRWADNGLIPSHRLPSGFRRFDLGEVLAFKRTIRAPIGAQD